MTSRLDLSYGGFVLFVLVVGTFIGVHFWRKRASRRRDLGGTAVKMPSEQQFPQDHAE